MGDHDLMRARDERNRHEILERIIRQVFIRKGFMVSAAEVAKKKVWPSGAERAAATAPIALPPPGLFSTMTL